MTDLETVVIGAGVVGLAVAAELARSGREVIVLEQNNGFGQETSSRNSEVVHAGIYYPKGSLKANLCVRGRHRLYRHCSQHNVYCDPIGKLIVATNSQEAKSLIGISKRAQDNGINDLKLIEAADAMSMEPALYCTAALHSPSTGIIDSHSYMMSLIATLEAHDGMIVSRSQVKSAKQVNGGFKLQLKTASNDRISCRELVLSAGLESFQFLNHVKTSPTIGFPKPLFAKGNYFSLTGKAPFNQLIYPVPVKGGLGVHFTRDRARQARFGPDVEWVDATMDGGIVPNYAVDSSRGNSFYAAIRRYWPDLPDGSLSPDYSGIRPKAASETPSDFIIKGPESHKINGLAILAAIESPGLTASLAIAETVVELLSSAI